MKTYNIDTTIKHGSKSFYFASLFMLPEDKQKLYFLYGLARLIDDIGDRSVEFGWSKEGAKSKIYDVIESPEVVTFFNENSIPITLLNDLSKGVIQDFSKKSYANFDELYTYCYKRFKGSG